MVETFKCKECGLHYLDEKTAKECEKYCKTKGMCSSKITSKSLERQKQD
ncbi:MAG: hypothetical protein GOV15_02465 [Candidatus Diapherotrites archaeon]|nr:hypothetical protein [Candidatus Diapherotrites archaeon]